jgi:hypothetical protein
MPKFYVKKILQKIAESFTVAQILSLYGSIDGTWGGQSTEKELGQKIGADRSWHC